jgi:uncharacterized protein (DUF1499 family)
MTTTLIIVVALFSAAFGGIYYQNNQVPELGVVEGKFKPLSNKPNCVSSQASDESKKVATLAFKADEKTTMAAILASVENYGGATVKQQTEDYLYVVFTTPTMKYNDDVEFWLDSNSKQVHFRSASRAGYSDRGLNRQRYQALAEFYAKQ